MSRSSSPSTADETKMPSRASSVVAASDEPSSSSPITRPSEDSSSAGPPTSSPPTLEETTKTKSSTHPGPRGAGPSTGSLGNQTRRHDKETFTLHPTDPTKLIAHFRIEHPSAPGTFYTQIDEIPIHDTSTPSPASPTFYFIPSLTASKIPARHRSTKRNAGQPNLWHLTPNSTTWTRASKTPGGAPDTWQPVVMFRRFNAATHAYEEIYLSTAKLVDVDPNDKKYQYAYNKWIDQIRRRRDEEYVKSVAKDHWSPAERAALYGGINAFVRRAGLEQFGFGKGGMGRGDVRDIAEKVSREGEGRGVDAVRSQIATAHARKNKAVWELLQRAEEVRKRVEAGEEVGRAERWPEEAIPKAQWPVEGGGKKRKTEVVESEEEMERGIEISGADISEPWWMRDTHPSGLRPIKKVRLEDAAGNQLSPMDDSWSDTDEEILSDTAQRIQDEMAWETCSDTSSPSDLEDADMQSAIEQSLQNKDADSDAASKFLSEAGETCSVPQRRSVQGKRKRVMEVEDEKSSDGDDEMESAQPQSRKTKKIRSRR